MSPSSRSRLDADDRCAALLALLALPDPPELAGRGFSTTCPRDPRRDPEILKRDLGTAYVAWRRQDHADGSAILLVRRSTRRPHAARDTLRVVR